MIQVTDGAAAQVLKLIQDDPKATPDMHLRVKVVTGGCSGMSYKLDFDSQVTPDDKVVEDKGIKILVDKKSYLYLVGMSLDYEGGLNGQGFTFNNPNANRTCGCGSSFGV
jgi:iron-sulfur cluster assembly protein